MTPRDIHNSITPVLTLAPQTVTGNGDNTECTGVDGSKHFAVEHIVQVGNSADTLSGSLYMDLILQDSADNVTYAAVTDPNAYIGTMVTEASGIFGVIDAPAEDTTYFSIGYRGTKRYSRVLIDRTGNHASGCPMSVIALKAHPRFAGTSGLLVS